MVPNCNYTNHFRLLLELLYNGIEYEDIVILYLYHSLHKTEANDMTGEDWRPKAPNCSPDIMRRTPFYISFSEWCYLMLKKNNMKVMEVKSVVLEINGLMHDINFLKK